MRVDALRRLPRRFARRVAALVAIVVAVGLPLAAQAGPLERRAEARLVVALPLEPPHLDPTATSAEATLNVVQSNIFEGLTRIDDDARLGPGLATDWVVSPDGLQWRFHLRHGVRFHDGSVLDASVVKFSLDRARAVGSTNPLQGLLRSVKGVVAETPDTVRIDLAQPAANLPVWLGWGNLAIVHPGSAAHNTTQPIGTGAFRFLRWRQGDSIELERNPNYWGAPARLQAVTLRILPDPATSLAALRAGDIDVFPNLPSPESVASLQRDSRFTVAVGNTEGETLLAINNARPPFNDVRVRRALAHAIDRRAILAGAMDGYGTLIGSHFSPLDPAALDLTGRYPFDPPQARRLLREAGVDLTHEWELVLPPPYYARRSGEIIATQLAAVGLRVRIRNIEWAQWLEQVFTHANYDLTLVAHTEPMDYDIYGRPGYYFGYDSPTYNALLSALERTSAAGARLALLQQVQRQLAEDAVNVWLFELPKFGVWRREVTGMWHNAPVQAIDLTAVAWSTGTGAATALPSATSSPNSLANGISHTPWPLAVRLMAAAVALAATIGLLLAARGHSLRFWWQRLAGVVTTLLGASLLVFLLVQVLPGDPAQQMLGLNATPEALQALRTQYGLDLPWWRQYVDWMVGWLQGDLGISYTYRVPVSTLLGDRLAVSLPLASLALGVALALALPWALLAARQRSGWPDRLLMTLAQGGLAVPNFWLGLLLVLVLAQGLGWFPAGGFPGWQAGLGNGLHSLWLPAFALGFPQACILARVWRSSLEDALASDYFRTARAKGLTQTQALLRHALPNSWPPVLALLGLQFGFLLAGAIVIETTFALPGIGRLVFQATEQRDLMVVRSVVLWLVAAVVLVNLVVDLATRRADARRRERP